MKKIIFLLLVFTFIFSICACGNVTDNTNNNNNTSSTSESVINSEQEETKTSTLTQHIQDGDKITIDDYCEFTVIGWDSVDEITRNGMKMITGPTNENNTLVRLTLDYTNTSKNEQKLSNNVKHVSKDDLLQAATLTYDTEYSYIGGCGCWSKLIPLTRDNLYIFFNVPKSILESDKPIVMEFKISEQTFKYTVR